MRSLGEVARGFLVAAALFQCGCERYAPAPPNPAAAPAERLADLKFAPVAGPLSISEVSLLAVANNPDLKAARNQRGIAAAQVLQAGILPNPSVTTGYAFLVGGPGTTAAFTASIGQDVKALVTLSAKKEAAVAAAQQVDASVLWQEWQTIGKARLLVVDIVEGARQRRLIAETLQALESRLQTEQQALAQANATLTDIVPALTAVTDIRKQLNDLDRQQQSRRHDLNALLGLAPDVALPLDMELRLPLIDLSTVIAALPDIADRRPDLIALQLGYRTEEAKLRAAILAQFPALVFGAAGGRDTTDVRSIGPQITMDLPIFDRNQANIAIERATRRQLYGEFTARMITSKGEVRAMLAETKLIERQIEIVRPQVFALQQVRREAEPAYRAGNLDERGYVDVVEAALAKEGELVSLEQLRLERLVALATLVGAGMPTAALPPAASTRS